MAGTVALIAASNNCLRYVFTATGADTNDDLTQARMIADCNTAGLEYAAAMKAKLEAPTTFGTSVGQQVAWAELALDPEITVIIAALPTPCLAGYDFRTVGPNNVIHLVSTGAGAVYVEIRFNPTQIR